MSSSLPLAGNVGIDTPVASRSPAIDGGRGWLVAVAAFVCLLLNAGVIVVYSYGVLTSAMAQQFGWSAVERSMLFVSFSICAVVAGPIWGALADKAGALIVVMVSAFLLAVSFSSLALLRGDLLSAHLLFAAIGLLGGGTTPPIYASFVVGWFNRRRGLALGLAMVGVGAGAALLPAIAGKIVSEHGWQTACVTIGAAVLFISLPVALFFLRPYPAHQPARDAAHAAKGNAASPAIMPLVTAAFRQSRTLVLAAFAFVSGAVLVAIVTNFVPLLHSRGLSLAQAAQFQSIIGIGLVIGRLGSGALVDRLFAPRVVTAILLVATVGLGALHEADSTPTYIFGALSVGLAIGMEVDFLGYIVSRYYARLAFTTIFAILFAMYSLGATVGPPLFAALVKASGGYGTALLTCAALLFAMSLLIFALPRYEKHV